MDFEERQQKIKDLLNARKTAYNLVFSEENVYTKQVLEDLKKFCRAERSSFHPDPRLHAVIEGRREVWLRIQDFLTRSITELEEIYATPKGDSTNE